MKKYHPIQLVLGIILIVGVIFSWNKVFGSLEYSALRVNFLDIGQGDATLVTTPHGQQVLIDTSINQIVLRALGEVMSVDDTYIDIVLLTHPDADHVGGTVDVLTAFDVGMLVTSSSSKETEVTRAIDVISQQKGTPRRILRRGDVIIIDPISNVKLHILSPGFDMLEDDANDYSLIMKLSYGDTCMIFPGDASQSIELTVIKHFENELNCDVLKVGHHGSRTSTSDVFVGHVSPQYAIVSAGVDNSFGHPHQEVIDVLTKFNVTILETKKQGTITLFSDGKSVWLTN